MVNRRVCCRGTLHCIPDKLWIHVIEPNHIPTSLSTMEARFYNQIPASFKQLTGKAMKKKLDSCLLKHPIYTVQEFTGD
ncbi:hypothetical protein J6590_102345 [Homalodisca vitripennis]|nr:hypothetical protein J6590_102345 [Homalodisca vitripennis]